jgi:hypothetical protein
VALLSHLATRFAFRDTVRPETYGISERRTVSVQRHGLCEIKCTLNLIRYSLRQTALAGSQLPSTTVWVSLPSNDGSR